MSTVPFVELFAGLVVVVALADAEMSRARWWWKSRRGRWLAPRAAEARNGRVKKESILPETADDYSRKREGEEEDARGRGRGREEKKDKNGCPIKLFGRLSV